MSTYIYPEGGGGGITELTGDVVAGPGTGSQAATVEGLQGNPVSNAAPALNEVLTWDGAQWIPAATGGGYWARTGTVLSPATAGDTVTVDIPFGTAGVSVEDSGGAFYSELRPANLFLTDNNVKIADLSAATATLTLRGDSAEVPPVVPTIIAQDAGGPLTALDLSIGELRVNTLPGAAGEVLTSNGPGVAPTWQAGGGASLALDPVRVATAAALPANSYAAGVLTASTGGSINAVGIDGVTTLALADRVLVKDEAAGLKNQVYTITDLGSPASGPATPAVPAPPTFSGALLTCGSGGTYATLTAAVAAASPGDRIQILPGTITEAAAVAVNKSLEIFGTGATCIVQRNSTTSVIAVTTSNVYLHDFKLINNQLASADPGGQSCCVGADTMNRTSLGGATGLYFANLTCEMPKVGIFVSGTSWVVRDCAFSPSAANTTAGTTLRAVFAYGSEGTSFINDNTFLTTLDNARLTAIYLNTRNDGIAPNWEGGYKGSLIIDGNAINDAGGAPRSYIDATSIYHQSGTATTAPPNGQFSLYIVNNDFSLDHQSSPCVFFGRSYGATPVAPLSFFLDLVVSDNLFGAREASASQKGALFWTSTSGSGVSMGALVGGFYGANNTIDPMVLPATNTSIMADSSLLMVRENAFYSAPSPLLTLVPLNPGAPWTLTVAADFTAVAQRGVFTSVNQGTQNTATSWIITTQDPLTLGTTALTWDLFGKSLTIQDEGSPTVAPTKAVNFVGAGVTVTNAGSGVATVTIPGGGGGVTSVGASSPLASSGGSTPTISLSGVVGVANGGTGNSASPASGQLLLGNGAGFTLGTLTEGAGITITNAAGSVTVAVNANAPQSIVLDATATGGTATIIGTIYVPATRMLTGASAAYMGGSLVGDTSVLTLNPAGGGTAVATWTRTGTLGSQAATGTPTIAAGWYDLTLQGTAGSGVAFARGLYLV